MQQAEAPRTYSHAKRPSPWVTKADPSTITAKWCLTLSLQKPAPKTILIPAITKLTYHACLNGSHDKFVLFALEHISNAKHVSFAWT